MYEEKTASQTHFLNGCEDEVEVVPIKTLMSESGHRTLLGYCLFEVRSHAGQNSDNFTSPYSVNEYFKR